MPVKPLISKIRCHNPNRHSSVIKNYNSLLYIATRPGVDLSIPDFSAELDSVELPDLSTESDSVQLRFPLTESDSVQLSDSITGDTKNNEIPQAHGLFGNFDTSNLKQVSDDVRRITDSGVNVFRGIISLSEEDTISLGYNQKEPWISYMNSVMPDVGNIFGIPITSLRWCAAIHMEHGHPHCHYMFWRTDGKTESPFIHCSRQNKVREFLSGEMFKQERELNINFKNFFRDKLLEETDAAVSSLTEHIHIPERIALSQLPPLYKDLFDLANALPGHGRLSYKLLPPACKEILEQTIHDLLNIPAVRKEYSAYLKSAEAVSATYSPSVRHNQINIITAEEDIHNRMANTILKAAKKFLLTEQSLFPTESDSAELPDLSTEPDSVELHLPSTESDSVELPNPLTESDSVELHSPSTESGSVKPFRKWWSTDFKELKAALYELKPDDAQYNNQLKAILSSLENMHLSGNRAATLILAKTYNSPKYAIQNKDLAGKYYQTVYSDFNSLISTATDKAADYMYFQLAKICENGYGRNVDYEEAAQYYKACIHNNPHAWHALAKIYLSEKIAPLTEETYIQAMIYLERSSHHIPYAAFDYAAELEKDRFHRYAADPELSDRIRDNYTCALNGFLKQENTDKDDNHDKVLYKIGTMYYKGQGCTSDPEKAYTYFLRAAEQHNKHAYYALGKTCADKESPHYDPKRAMEYYNDALKDVDDPPAYITNAMAALYAAPDTELYNIQKAIELYTTAAQNGDTCALRRLGSIYLFGKGVERDEELGLRYINAAIDGGDEYAKETLDFYNNMKEQMAASFSYSLIQALLRSWGNHQNRHNLLSSSIGSRSLSKEAQIAEAKKKQEHSYAQEEQPDIP